MTSMESDTNTRSMQKRLWEIGKFLLAGGTSAGANIAVFFVLSEMLGLWYLFSTVISFCCGLGTHFLMQRHMVFPESRAGNVHWQFGSFMLAALVNLVCNVSGMFVLVEYAGLMPTIAQVIVLGLLAIMNFFLYKLFIFKI